VKKIHYKFLGVVIAGITGILIIVYQSYFLKQSYEFEKHINNELKSIQTKIINLQYLIIQSSYLLYFNNDDIPIITDKIEKSVAHLMSKNGLNSSNFSKSYKILIKLKKDFTELKKDILRFLTLNASIKNSAIYIPKISSRLLYVLRNDKKYSKEIIELIPSINIRIIMSKNALDDSFIKDLKNYQKSLKEIVNNIDDKKNKRLISTLLKHLEVFINNFSTYKDDLNRIVNTPVSKDSYNLIIAFNEEMANSYNKINHLSKLFLIIFLTVIILIIYLIFLLDKENKILKKTKNELEISLITDSLTKLKNRLALNKELKNSNISTLTIINIDKFKNINELYGSEIGDMILKEITKVLQKDFENKKSKCFRIGGDEFAILSYYEMDDIIGYIKNIINTFNNTYKINELDIDVTITAGLSNQKDLILETAEMALKYAKNDINISYAIYNKSMDTRDKIKENINILKKLKIAIEDDRIVPYYQPIYEIKSREIEKYESLVRLIDNGKAILPYYFLDVVKDAKLSNQITRIVLTKTLEKSKKSDLRFSVNISPYEIESKKDLNKIVEILNNYKTVTKNLTFEILESAEIENYDAIYDFTKIIKDYGCKLAIDDFGSGYSNFEKLLKMEIDLIKIDGSLIKEIDQDKNAEMVVKTIIEFAKSVDAKTVAEFVHSKNVLQKVEELGIDMAQGFYLGKPEPDILYTSNGVN